MYTFIECPPLYNSDVAIDNRMSDIPWNTFFIKASIEVKFHCTCSSIGNGQLRISIDCYCFLFLYFCQELERFMYLSFGDREPTRHQNSPRSQLLRLLLTASTLVHSDVT